MEPKLIFWTVALVDLAAVAALAASGVRQRRRGDVKRHARNMIAAVSLVLLFLVAYVAEVWLLGKEDRGVWSPLQHWVLWLYMPQQQRPQVNGIMKSMLSLSVAVLVRP